MEKSQHEVALDWAKAAQAYAITNLEFLGYSERNWMTPGLHMSVHVTDKFALGIAEVGILVSLFELHACTDASVGNTEHRMVSGDVWITVDGSLITTPRTSTDIVGSNPRHAQKNMLSETAIMLQQLRVLHAESQFVPTITMTREQCAAESKVV